MILTAVTLMALAFIVAATLWVATHAGWLMYLYLRRRDARPLTDEEKWQETSSESMSEEEWAALIASMPQYEPRNETTEDDHRP